MKTRIILTSIYLGMFVLLTAMSFTDNSKTLNTPCNCSECTCSDCSTYCSNSDCCSDGECNMKNSGSCNSLTASCESMSCCNKGFAGSDIADITNDTCMVSGDPVTEGGAVQFKYLGKSYTFCCDGCIQKFKKEPLNYIKSEMNCPVMGEPVDKNVFLMQDGTKYYLCCKSCVKKFEANPVKYMGN